MRVFFVSRFVRETLTYILRANNKNKFEITFNHFVTIGL